MRLSVLFLGLATGSTDSTFSAVLYTFCLTACSSSLKSDKYRTEIETGILNALHALQPQDEIEGMLITKAD